MFLVFVALAGCRSEGGEVASGTGARRGGFCDTFQAEALPGPKPVASSQQPTGKAQLRRSAEARAREFPHSGPSEHAAGNTYALGRRKHFAPVRSTRRGEGADVSDGGEAGRGLLGT